MSDSYNSFDPRNIVTSAYGHQILNRSFHSLGVDEFIPVICYDNYCDNDHNKQALEAY